MQHKDTESPARAMKLLSTLPKMCANLSAPVAEPTGHKVEAELKERGPVYLMILLN